MSLCGRYDFVEPPVTYRVCPYYFKEDDLLPQELHLFDKTVLGYFVDASTVKVGQRCRVRPQVNLAKHLFATLSSDSVSDSLQGRFQVWLSYRPTDSFENALESFLGFIDDNVSRFRVTRTVDFLNDLDQAVQYHWFVFNKMPYVAIQPHVESVYLPAYQKPEFYKVESLQGFERFRIPFVLAKDDQTFWYENIDDFYKGGGYGFPTRSRWLGDGPVFEAFTDVGWLEVTPYEIHLARTA